MANPVKPNSLEGYWDCLDDFTYRCTSLGGAFTVIANVDALLVATTAEAAMKALNLISENAGRKISVCAAVQTIENDIHDPHYDHCLKQLLPELEKLEAQQEPKRAKEIQDMKNDAGWVFT